MNAKLMFLLAVLVVALAVMIDNAASAPAHHGGHGAEHEARPRDLKFKCKSKRYAKSSKYRAKHPQCAPSTTAAPTTVTTPMATTAAPGSCAGCSPLSGLYMAPAAAFTTEPLGAQPGAYSFSGSCNAMGELIIMCTATNSSANTIELTFFATAPAASPGSDYVYQAINPGSGISNPEASMEVVCSGGVWSTSQPLSGSSADSAGRGAFTAFTCYQQG